LESKKEKEKLYQLVSTLMGNHQLA